MMRIAGIARHRNGIAAESEISPNVGVSRREICLRARLERLARTGRAAQRRDAPQSMGCRNPGIVLVRWPPRDSFAIPLRFRAIPAIYCDLSTPRLGLW